MKEFFFEKLILKLKKSAGRKTCGRRRLKGHFLLTITLRSICKKHKIDSRDLILQFLDHVL
jgi:hypothetical protein